ncbi:WGR domain protein [Enhygromyxa salina]|uniref:WGR domain protein n=1 Tax=Enhygromyxa salina TaxID=215803 RepID=A0A0C2D2P9_9BACT|nr:WGR domain protein [Enhygromyxa salina]
MCVVGDVCLVRRGAHGGQGASEVEPCASERDAQAFAQTRARQWLEQGYQEVRVVPSSDTQPFDPSHKQAIERELAADPRNVDTWLVYADFLQGVMPSSSERIMLEIVRDASPPATRHPLDQLCRRHDRRHRRAWVGASLGRLIDKRGKTAPGLELDWRYGFIARGRVLGRSLEGPLERPDLDVVMAALLGSAAARFMTSLTLTAGNSPREQFRRALAHVVTAEPRPTLTHLKLSSREVRVDLGPVLAALPGLERLELSTWPAEPGAEPSLVDGLGEHLNRNLAKLEHLVLRAPGQGDALIHELLRSGCVAGLTHLSITSSRVTHVGVEQLVGHAGSFDTLEQLDLRDNEITKEWADALARAFPGARVNAELFNYDGKRVKGLRALADDDDWMFR